MSQLPGLGLGVEVLHGLGHAVQAEFVQQVEGGVSEHVWDLLQWK